MWDHEYEEPVADKSLWFRNRIKEEEECADSEENSSRAGTDTDPRKEFSLFISGLSLETSNEELGNLCRPFGPIRQSVVIYRNNNGKVNSDTTYGFVTFVHEEHANQAINNLNRTQYKDRELVVDWSKRNRLKNFEVSRKHHGHQKEQLETQDELNLYNLIHIYIQIRSLESSDLPEPCQFLQELSKVSYHLVKPYKVNDPELKINLEQLINSFMTSLSEKQ